MTSIISSYNSLYSSSSSNLSSLLSSAANSTDDDTATTTTSTTDTVTISAAALSAIDRDALGLPATGALSLSDFETAIADQEETVNTLLASAMEELGIDAGQEVSLTLASDGSIEIENTFDGSDELEEALNSNSDFTDAFTGLTANTEILNFKDYLLNKSTSLADYMDSDEKVDLLSLAAKSDLIKSAGTSLSALWSISRSETEYTYTYEYSG